MSGWIRQTRERGRGSPAAELSAQGVVVREGALRLEASWDQVFGVALMPPEDPERVYLLVPRPPPAPPWIEITGERLPADTPDLNTFADRVRSRVAQSGYRDRGPQRPLLPPDQLMERVIARQDVPGALEIPVGAGPGGWWRRGLDVLAAGSAGGLFGLYGGALTGSAVLAVAAAGVGVAAGAGVPVAFARNWRSVRGRSQRPRVLVLAPDGCVVGLPTGPEAFAWDQVGRFSAEGGAVQVTRRDGTVAGTIDAAWFGAPLALIVAVAEAYATRQKR